MISVEAITKEIMKQQAIAEAYTGKSPKRVILGITIVKELLASNKFMHLIDESEYIRNMNIDGMQVTVDYDDKELIKVIPEI